MNASATLAAAAPHAVVSHDSLSVTDLHKRYGEREVLRGVSLTAQPGDVIAIVGSSGSGKSTLLRCLNLLEQPRAGSFKLGGETLALKPDHDGSLRAADARQLQRWRARLSMVFQGFNLWQHRTALENVTEAPIHVLKQPRAQAIERARELLAQVGLSHRQDVYPAQLSGGEQQRVAIARALANDPVLVIADEPTGNLDERATRGVFQLLRDINAAGTTIIMATHDLDLVKRAECRTLELNHGALVFDSAAPGTIASPSGEGSA